MADEAKRIKDAAVALAKKKWNEAAALAKAAADKAAKITRDALKKAKELKDAAAKKLKEAKDIAWKAAKDAAAAAGKALKDAKDAAVRLAKAALDKAVELAKAAALAIAKAACKALQWTLDKVIATVVSTIAKAGVAAVMVAGKMVAKGLELLAKAIDVRRIYYAGSLAQAVKGNFGLLELDISILQKKYEFSITLDVNKIFKAIVDTVVPKAIKKAAAAIGL